MANWGHTAMVQQAINESTTLKDFRSSAVLLQDLIRNNRDPHNAGALCAQLAYRGHVLITYGHPARPIADAVVTTLNTDPAT